MSEPQKKLACLIETLTRAVGSFPEALSARDRSSLLEILERAKRKQVKQELEALKGKS